MRYNIVIKETIENKLIKLDFSKSCPKNHDFLRKNHLNHYF